MGGNVQLLFQKLIKVDQIADLLLFVKLLKVVFPTDKQMIAQKNQIEEIIQLMQNLINITYFFSYNSLNFLLSLNCEISEE